MQTQQPNILFIMTDQQRYDSLGCYGADWVQTPHLDKLAHEGVLFEHCYANNPLCTPSRASIFTGKSIPGHGVYKVHDLLPDNEIPFTKRLQGLGYNTALFGKLHLSGRVHESVSRHPNDGFDTYEWVLGQGVNMDSPFNAYVPWLQQNYPEFHQRLMRERRKLKYVPRECHLTHWAAERTIDFLQNRDKHHPFFCMMSIIDPHDPYENYPLDMRDFVDEDRIPAPLLEPVDNVNRPYGIRQEQEHSYVGAFRQFTADDLKKIRLGYFASITLIDREVGRVLKTLKEEGLRESTLVIFVSDHGDMLGDHNLMVKGAFFYDPGVKVPLIIRWPEKYPSLSGQRVSSLVQPNDLAATVLSAAGFPSAELHKIMPESADLASLATGGQKSVHDVAICCYRNSGICDRGHHWAPAIHATMLRDDRYKLNLYHANPAARLAMEGQLFDMLEDPHEMNDLWGAPAYQALRLHLMERLLEWMFNQELRLGTRGGDAIPDRSQLLANTLK
jgi:arylsulfatase A-like enzyme